MKITAYWERSEEKRGEYQQQLAEHSKCEFFEMPIVPWRRDKKLEEKYWKIKN